MLPSPSGLREASTRLHNGTVLTYINNMEEQYQSEENKYVSPPTEVECHNPGATM
jgi:hypothetical protein